MKELWKAAIGRGRRRRRQQQFRTGDHHLFFMRRDELLPPAAANAQASCPKQQPHFAALFPVRTNTRHCADEADLATPGSEAEAALAGLVEVPGVVAGSSISSPAYPAAAGRVGDV